MEIRFRHIADKPNGFSSLGIKISLFLCVEILTE